MCIIKQRVILVLLGMCLIAIFIYVFKTFHSGMATQIAYKDTSLLTGLL